MDDILDLIADSQKLGKTAGIDIAQGKGLATALAGHGNGGNGNGHGVAVIEVDQADPMSAFKQKMLAGNYIQEGRENAERLAQIAGMNLMSLPPSPALDELLLLTRQVVERDH